jgi:galactokinase
MEVGPPPHRYGMLTDMATWMAPGRVNLIGEHTDYNGGFVLPFALPLGVTARTTARDDDVLQLTSTAHDDPVSVALTDLGPGAVDGWAAYGAGVAWALRSAGMEIGGADVALDSDLPTGAGLSSSAALECAVAGALTELYEIELDPSDHVRLCHRAENEFVGVPSGILDQSASVLCRAGHALFLDARSLDTRQVPLPLSGQGLSFLVIDTRVHHALADGEYAARRDECSRAAEALGVGSLRDADLDDVERLPDELLRRRARHVLTENARVLRVVELLEGGADVRSIGALLIDSHRSMRDDFEISCRELDIAVDTAVAVGAHGARMTGGGFGGSAIALVDESDADAIGAAVERAFAAADLAAPNVFAAVPSDGARPIS